MGRPSTSSHFVSVVLDVGIEHQSARLRIDPDPHAALLGEGHGRQVQLGLVLELLLAGFAALGHEAHHSLTGRGFDQPAVLLAARRHPAHGAFLCGAALLKPRLLQGILQCQKIALPALGDAVNAPSGLHEKSPL